MRPPIPPEDFPKTGYVTVRDFVSTRSDRGVYPFAKTTFLAFADKQKIPFIIMHNRRCYRAEYIRAISEGRRWDADGVIGAVV